MTNNKINYSQCWEDADILIKALQPKPSDTVVSITSGGDNSIIFAQYGVKKLISVDTNIAQNYLLELKLAALKKLSPSECLEFLGFKPSLKRESYYKKIKSYISNDARKYWGENLDQIEKGVIHSGKLEKYLGIFRKFVLPVIHNKKTIDRFVNVGSMAQQRNFYITSWNTWRWRLYFRIASSRLLLSRYARQKGMFDNYISKDVSNKYLKRLESNLINIHLATNYYLKYCLTGNYENYYPVYIRNHKKGFDESNIKIFTGDILNCLKLQPDNSINKFNLSDIFDGINKIESKSIWLEILRVSKKGALVIYWENLVRNTPPKEVLKDLIYQKLISEKLHKKDKLFFYSNFYVYKIK